MAKPTPSKIAYLLQQGPKLFRPLVCTAYQEWMPSIPKLGAFYKKAGLRRTITYLRYTLGNSLPLGDIVGEDEKGTIYTDHGYTYRGRKRLIWYRSPSPVKFDASDVPPRWWGWIHWMHDDLPGAQTVRPIYEKKPIRSGYAGPRYLPPGHLLRSDTKEQYESFGRTAYDSWGKGPTAMVKYGPKHVSSKEQVSRKDDYDWLDKK
eukprot:TRINITY_DN10169_c0_g1_i1.p1 TRINITY_DN10169_c0_g1~~TRINITY_DN10169_c0_g1_i1.p1  ORF type:complete len:205 (-),score=15.76 TRINITY_DN10169_c0_g1_i1:59-673(-)